MKTILNTKMKTTIFKTKTMNKNLFKVAFLAATALFISCDDDDPVVINEEETITTVIYELENVADANDVVTLTYVDTDADGPIAPTTTVSGPLTAGATYEGDIEFLDETDPNDVEDITEEVEEEDDEHEVFYVVSTADVTIVKNDVDGDGNPLGLETTATVGSTTGTGTLTIVLRHEPMKPNTGLADAGGETDVEAVFNIDVQ